MRLIVLFFTLILFNSCEKKEEKKEIVRPVRAVQLEEVSDIQTRRFPGRTRAVKRVNLSFRVDGPMIKRPVDIGVKVKKGELLAKIDPRDYEVKLQNARGSLERAKAELRFAKRDAERSQNIFDEDPGAISQSYLDRKKEDVNRLKGEVLSLTAQVEAAKDQLQYTNLLSPYDGIIVAIYAQPFEYVQAKQPILRMLNTTQVEMVIDVPENMISEVPHAKEIIVDIDAVSGKEFPATIKEIGTEASVTTRTFPVTLLIEQPDDATILAGMAGYAKLSGERTPDFNEMGFIVPPSALLTRSDKNGSYVWIVDENELHRQPVTIGTITSQGVLITKGLKKGDWIVTAGVHSLYEGQKVKIFGENE